MSEIEKRSVAVVFNPRAGGATSSEDGEALASVFARDFDVRLFSTTRERSGEDCAREALAAGASVIVAAGGDGTVSQVAGALVGSDATLVVVPRGTANSFAAALDIPAGAEDVYDLLRAGSVQEIDTASCQGRTMVLHASVGAHAEVIGGTRRDAKNRWGALAYAATALEKLVSLEPFAVRIEADAHVIVCTAIAVTVANVAPIKTLVAQGPAEVRGDDALLDVTIVAATGLLDAVAAGAHLLRTAMAGVPVERDDIGFFACRRVRIETDPPQHVLVDGEPLGNTPLEAELRPRSLRVVAPPRAHAAPVQPAAKLVGLPDVSIHPREQHGASQPRHVRGRPTGAK